MVDEMPDLIIFSVAIPLTENATGLVHPPAKLREWFHRTAEIGGGGTEMGIALLGLWYEQAGKPPIHDYSNWYKFGVPPDKTRELREHVRKAAKEFGQICIYFERSGEADFLS